MKERNWSYLAGIVDGEGSIGISCSQREDRGCSYKQYELFISIRNTDVRLMKWLIEHFGGVYYANPVEKGWKPSWHWRPKGHKNKELLLLGLLPYLVLKRDQALLGLEYLRLGATNCPSKRHALCLRTRELNRRGESVETNTLDSGNSEKIESGLTGDSESAPDVNQVA